MPWLTILALIPLVGAIALMAAPARRRAAQAGRARHLRARAGRLGHRRRAVRRPTAATSSSSCTSGSPRSARTTPWASTGSGLLLVLLTTILTPVVILASWNDADDARWSVNAFFALMLALEGLAIGVFAATDVFLFYVLFEATLIPIYFLIGGFGGPQRSYAAVKFLLYSLFGGLLMLASVIGLYVVSSEDGRRTVVPAAGPDEPAHRPEHRPLAVPRLLHRVRDQGADVAGAHLAARRGERGDAGHVGAAGQHPRQDRHVRDDALLPRPLPRGVEVGEPGDHGAGGLLGDLRRAAGHRPERHPAADRLHLDLALRLHRARASSR